ncbi:hypothetical protein MNBD_UNCLBAC01-503 [hydrothermal vent metagenome]|uniref:Glycosyltransferase RgtA/B/C/D-like domain-containing protein n=1 Tax=hydrothermal vent metagenome TaxID=652676 RepID=A0A3B1E1S2_9ZZZZ
MCYMFKQFKSSFHNPIFWVFFLSITYWLYLASTVGIVLVHDSVGYQELGKTFYRGGLVEYLTTGPNREPVYPFFISMAMRIADKISVSYTSVLIIMQVIVLFAAQSLLFLLLQKMKINRWITAGTLLYMGFSPAIVNMAYSVYSEIATYPVVLGMVLLGAYCWKNFFRSHYFISALQGLGLAAVFLWITFIKGIYEYIFIFFFLAFSVRFFITLFTKEKRKYMIGGFIFLLVFGGVFKGGVSYYKSLNQKYNGTYALADSRGLFSLYSSAARRTEDMSTKRILAGIVYTMGEGACVDLFGRDECYFWGIHHYDSYGIPKLQQVHQAYAKNEVSKEMMRLSKEKILQKPLPFTFWMGMEWARMFFWESTQIGFVVYPDWLAHIFNHKLFKNIIRLGVSLLSLISFLYALIFIIKNLKVVFYPEEQSREPVRILFFILFGICCHVGMYAIFMTITRFALPIAPLYLATIAFALDRILCKKKIKV